MNDLINGLFEFIGGLFCCLSCRRLILDRQWRGMSWVPCVFFTSWGYWNLYFYPSVGCWYSFAGGAFLVTVNTFYCFLLYMYRNN